MSLMVLMFFVDKTSLELVYLKKEFQKKVVCLKKISCEGKKKKTYSRISFVLACKALMSYFFFYCGLFRCVCVQQNVIFFSFKEKSENI